jgi:hypothetical protein
MLGRRSRKKVARKQQKGSRGSPTHREATGIPSCWSSDQSRGTTKQSARVCQSESVRRAVPSALCFEGSRRNVSGWPHRHSESRTQNDGMMTMSIALIPVEGVERGRANGWDRMIRPRVSKESKGRTGVQGVDPPSKLRT